MTDNNINPHPFSSEIPGLLQQHLDHLRASDISLEVIRERGYRSILGKKELADMGFSPAQQRIPGILIPLHGPDGTSAGYQYRPDRPRLNLKGKPIKYENLTGSSIRLDVPPRCRSMIGDPQIPIWFVEGVKKADALASRGACAIALLGVWGLKGKNPLGGTTVLADFDYLALRGRVAYIAYDSDCWDNPQVRKALDRLAEHLGRKGIAEVKVAYLPSGPQGEKVGVDDYLAQDHSLEDLIALAAKDSHGPPAKKARETYVVEDGRICWVKRQSDGEVVVPLCNFTAKAVEDIIKDDGIEKVRFFAMEGTLGNSKTLPRVQIPASSFNSLGWVTDKWGMKAVIAAGTTAKDRLREAIQLYSQDAPQRRVYTHGGWRMIDGKRAFLTASGALGAEGVDVEMEGGLARYRLPLKPGNAQEAMRHSLAFLDIGPKRVTIPHWGAMHLAPLSEILNPAFTLWDSGPTGAFKSTLVALALCHYGEFTDKTLPASWRDTANRLEKDLFLAKDLPLVIDDFAPTPNSREEHELEAKAEAVDRAQANRLGRGRLKADTSARARYIPRGVAISTGEQVPSGESHMARLFVIELEKGDIDRRKLTEAQQQAKHYPDATAGYILWLASRWEKLQAELPELWERLRVKAQAEGRHPRLPEAVAHLYLGLSLGLAFAIEVGAIGSDDAERLRGEGWATLLELADRQGERVQLERPANKFLDILGTLIAQGKVVLHDKDADNVQPLPWQEMAGWRDEDYAYLLPTAVYNRVARFCREQGDHFPVKQRTLWKDLCREGVLVHPEGRSTTVIWAANDSVRVLKIPIEALNSKNATLKNV